jgi:hypothetical protein
VWRRVFPNITCGFNLDPFSGPPGFNCNGVLENHYADITRDDVRNWYTPVLFDAKGRLKGTCGEAVGSREPLNDLDTDGDTIPDACDPCPHKVDEDYDITTTPDTDEDGVPDRCDLCPAFADRLTEFPFGGPNGEPAGTFQPDVDGDSIGDSCDLCSTESTPPTPSGRRPAPTSRNCNLETEISLHYAGLGLTEPQESSLIPERTPSTNRTQTLRSVGKKPSRRMHATGPMSVLRAHEEVSSGGNKFTGGLPGYTDTFCPAPAGQRCTRTLRNIIAHTRSPHCDLRPDSDDSYEVVRL